MAEATTGGPAPYAKGDDTLQCPQCGLFNDDGALFCDQCSKQLQERPGDYQPRPGDIVRCSNCPASNQPDAIFCDQCAARLSHSAYEAALAAAGAAATSSSGRQQPMTPSERTAYLREIELRDAERAALTPPPPTGRGDLADLAQAEEYYTRVDALWERLDTELKQARAESGLIPTAADAAEIADLQRRTDVAWASRRAAYAHRQELWDRERLTYYTPDMGLPPGDPQW